MSPLFLSPGNRLVTVFGGGKVALRKAKHFDGFRIRVVSMEIMKELEEIADETVYARIEPETAGRHMDGSDIVIAATNDHSLNNSLRDISMAKGIMTNSAHGGGDVLIPSVLRRPGYVVTVSSEGRVPAFPPYIIQQLEGFLDPSYDSVLELLMLLRVHIRTRIADQPGRAAFLAEVLADPGLRDRLDAEGVQAVFDSIIGEKGLR